MCHFESLAIKELGIHMIYVSHLSTIIRSLCLTFVFVDFIRAIDGEKTSSDSQIIARCIDESRHFIPEITSSLKCDGS